ncbi:putative receptor-like protein kinase At3g47110 isoform X2 [Spinacia oleracea]|uniref:Receptor-like protein kinase At3g47110 isoform X2 n=1 Tax=Spinacia oleracea TaxID=3562 RepID=A0ABM3QJM1_SPIOL|nr:putative receptor-like protein kinase At3g47110 isoform X2 [Spinacia oleracea]
MLAKEAVWDTITFILQAAEEKGKGGILRHRTDEEALLEFKSRIDQESLGVLASWNDSRDLCQWTGVICGQKHRKRVISLDLQGQKLAGFLSPGIGNLSFLRVLNLGNNAFRGNIPPEVGHLFRLQTLNLSYNSFQGYIPYSLSNCSNLADLSLEHNHLHGNIPSELGSLSELITLSFHDNNLTGIVPASIGNLSSLQQLLLFSNKLEGELPSSISQLSNLNQLGLSANKFYGKFPSSIYNLSSLQVISLAYNSFFGSLRPDIGLRLPELQILLLSTNNFTGYIPMSLANASRMTDIDLSTNNFIGDVPLNFGSLQDLISINLEENQLGGNDKDLKFINSLNNCSYLDLLSFDVNNFQSILPKLVTNLSAQLTWLGFGLNYIQGSIPEDMPKLSSLYVFSAEGNFLTGSISASLGQLYNLQVLSLAGNNLTGSIPSSLGNISGLSQLILNDNHLKGSVPSSIKNCKNLEILDLSNNEFNGSIPRELFDLSAINFMNMSNNHFRGPLPPEIGKWTGITSLDVSNNNLSGTIPTTLRNCLSLQELYMQKNMFQGSIPYLGELEGIQSIDLSHNNLSGQIPSFMVNMSALQKLNVSFNKLYGEVPTEGIFLNASAFDIRGNIRLCGGIPEFHLNPCPATKKGKTKKHFGLKYILPSLLLILLFGFILLLSVLYCTRNKREQKSLPSTPSKHFFPKISFQELFNATDGFSEANFIGSGAFGDVYKGILREEGTTVAVKVLKLQQPGALKSFIAECNALRSIRHRNLVKVLTACSSADLQGNDFKAIVYQYMPNGSLETWLHTEDGQLSKHLNLLQRISIAIDVAYALYYLHEECNRPVIHCDLKPSNVLLDEELTAHVSDFGLARLLLESGDYSTEMSVSQLSSVGFQGTIGYAAPEYGTASKMSTHGDVYSYGILLLEMFTRRRPTDERYEGNFNLREFVAMALPNQVLEIVDQSLLSEEEEIEASPENCSNSRQEQVESLIGVLQVGLMCSEENPRDRMKMEEVITKLIPIRDKWLGVKLHKSFRTESTDEFRDRITQSVVDSKV